jgi:hypothetical protein
MARKEADEVVLAEMNDAATEFPGTDLPAVRGTMELGVFVSNDDDAGDIPLPRLQLAYGVGGLAATNNPGDIVLGGDNLIAKKGETIRIIVLNATEYWKQRLTSEEYNQGIRPQAFPSKEQAQAAGGITDWSSNPMDPKPNFGRALNMKLLIEKPEGLVCSLFGVPVGDKLYAPAVWDVDKSAYKRVGPEIMNAAKFSLRTRGLLAGVFSLMTRSDKINGNATIVPIMKLVGNNTDEMIQEIKVLFGQG